jgi:hypothetical protein
VSESDVAEMVGKSSDKGFSIALGLTNERNLACAHSYRDTVGSIVCRSMTFGAFCENVRFDP